MDAQKNVTTSLEDLARRLEALELENAELRGKVAALEGSAASRQEVKATRGSEPSEDLEESRISRRRLLGKAGAAAAGLVVAGALTQRDLREAQAATGIDEWTTNTAGRGAQEGTNTSVTGYGVRGRSPDFVGVEGTGAWGVTGTSDPGDGSSGSGVLGSHRGSGSGVSGDSEGGRGVQGRSFGGTTGAVEGEHFGGGYGGQFKGGRAQLRLGPSGRSGRPGGAHSKGEIYMDSNAALFVCVRGGTPGRWKKVSTTAV